MISRLAKLSVLIAVLAFAAGEDQQPESGEIPLSCDSWIYCQGDLLHAVQMARIFPDSKSFVDMRMLEDEKVILKQFDVEFPDKTQIDKQKLTDFVHKYFAEGGELEPHYPADYKPNPEFISKITQPDFRAFAETLVSIWPNLTRRIKDDVFTNQKRYSIIPVRQPFVIPGGRFKEFYYWDSYWVLNGLLISEMYDTARGMLDNFMTMVNSYGFVPNGGRVYYRRRSQPPMLTSMVAKYYETTGDIAWLKENILTVEEEVRFWLKRRVKISLNGRQYKLARYFPESLGPRPESYREDYELVQPFTDDEKQRMYVDLKGAAESGWDFSSRWFYDAEGSSKGNLTDIHTRRTIPVDLNSMLYKACVELQRLFKAVGRRSKASYWKNKATSFKKGINEVLWNDDDGIWYDVDLDTLEHRAFFTGANLAPMWAKAHYGSSAAIRVEKYLEQQKIFDFPGGTPVTLHHTGEQWDFPNVWAPVQEIVTTALANNRYTKHRAQKLAEIWVTSVMTAYNNEDKIFEKYNAEKMGHYGEGGEYTVQTGFGWTNGVTLQLIDEYFTEY